MATTTTTTDDQFNPNPNPNPNNEISVLFYDGEREIDLGKVQITPLMTFKLLQTTLSNIIGISPNHITIYLDRNNTVINSSSNSQRRRHPVTSKFDFSSLDTVRSYLWVVLKWGRRNRRRRKTHLDNENAAPFVLLRRGLDIYNNNNQYMTMISELEIIERQKEFSYLMSLNLNSHVYNELSGGNYNYNYDYGFGYDNYSDEYYSSCSSNSGPNTERVYCEVCCGDENGGVISFHWCKNDAVVGTGFRPVVGPIAPPNKTGILR